MKTIIVCVLLLLLFHKSDNYRILGIFPFPGKSHMIMFENVMKGLAAKGHEVDVMSHFPLKQQVPRYNDISIQGIVPFLVNNVSMSLIKSKLTGIYTPIQYLLNEAGSYYCEAVFTSRMGNELKNTNKKYDLVVTHLFGSDCMLGFAHHFKIPVVFITTCVNIPWGGTKIGNPDNPSYIPNYFLSYVNPFNILERFTNSLTLLLAQVLHRIATKSSNSMIRNFFGPDSPNLEELAYKTSLILVNSHFSINIARPKVPNFVEVGGLHITPPKPLPKYLKHSVDVTSQYKGVIYLSMGSMILSESMSPYKLRALFGAFSELPYKILWKGIWENMPKGIDIPSNVQFEPWLPQLDILCHPNTKLFVTHGGVFGMQESVYCGIPSLGIPFYIDQRLNLKTSEAKGFTLIVEYDNISKESILETAKKLLEDPRYQANAKRVSKLFRDRPITALDTATYWIEHVIRHNGAPHLRSLGADLPWYKYLLIDVGIILLTFLSTIIILIYYLNRYTLRLLVK